MSDYSEMQRLELAMNAWLDFREGATTSAEEFLARHEELRDLLEPLLGAEPLADEPDAAAYRGPELLHPGSEFDDYRVVRAIGRGGMGTVVEAWQKSLDRRVAIKALSPGVAEQPKSVARFKREALTAARLDHPGIVKIHAVGSDRGVDWFAMELVDGPALDEYAEQLRVSRPADFLPTIIKLIVAVARAIQHAHDCGVIHRDLKPSNILVRSDGTPVITDLGLSRELDLPSITMTREFAGTPFYVSPEQLRGSARAGPQSDVFALGVTLYELLTDTRPFDGDSTQAVFDQILHRDPVSPEQRMPGLPRDLGSVVVKALEKRPRDRYASAAALADDLERFLQFRPVRARRVGRLGRAWRFLRRDRLRTAGASMLAAALLVVLALGGYVWWTGSATEAGQRMLTSDQVETLFLDAMFAPYEQPETAQSPTGAERKQSLVEQAYRIGRADPYVRYQAIHYEMSKGGRKNRVAAGKHALEMLDEAPLQVQRAPAFVHLRHTILGRIGATEQATAMGELPAPRSALDHYAVGDLMMLGLIHAPAGEGLDRRRQALHHAQRAIVLSAVPRSSHFLLLKRTAMVIQDKAIERMAVDALVRHWPHSAAAWSHRAMTYGEFDDEVAVASAQKSLALKPDNLFGIAVLGQVAERRGEFVAARRSFEKAKHLYPKASRMFHFAR